MLLLVHWLTASETLETLRVWLIALLELAMSALGLLMRAIA